MRNIVGQVARGEDFFPRITERKEIETALSSGSNILLTAPRRTGKTSILYNLLESPKSKCAYFYAITESVKTTDEFYDRLIGILYDSIVTPTRKTKDSLKGFLENINSVNLFGSGVSLSKEQPPQNKKVEMKAILDLLVEEHRNVVIMIDEFPQAIVNISVNEGQDKAIQLLQELREFRHEAKYLDRVQYVLTGSIGLENVVSNLDSMSTINDLTVIKVGPLDKERAALMVSAIAEDMNIEVSKEDTFEILEMVEWLIPFHIQVFMQELGVQVKSKNRVVSSDTFSMVMNEVIKNKVYFEHWRIRLKGMMSDSEYMKAETVLSAASKIDFLSREDVFKSINRNKPNARRKRQGATMKLNSILDILVHDGYFHVLPGDPPKYAFISPFLKTWWRRSVAI